MVNSQLGTIISSLAVSQLGINIVGNATDVLAATPVVNLTGIGSFSGIPVSVSGSGYDLPRTVDSWLGIDYAAQPIGDARFKPIQRPPEAFQGIKEAIAFGPVCIQDPAYIPAEKQNEACLSFNVYRPSGIPISEKLPTLIWIHGGAFALYSASAFDGAAFVASSKRPIAVVTFNYRLNAFGSLPSKLFEREKLLNLGLQDQRALLEFIHKHIGEFGGDPEQITLGGLSAGSHSAAFQYFHNYGDDKDKQPLFARVILQSGAPTARAFPTVDYPRYKQDFERLMKHVECSLDDGDSEQLDCLRKVPARKIEEISSKIYAEAESNLNWPWQPVLGGPFLEKSGCQSGIEQSFHHLPIITTHTTDEGKYYTPGHLQTNDDFIEFWHAMSPHLNRTDLAILNELYPDPVAHPDSPWANSPNSTQYNRISASWSDMAYICPSRETAYRTSTAGVPTWRLRFNTPAYPLEQATWRGIAHASDSTYIWNEANVPYPTTARIYNAYMTSFVATGNPNTHRLEGTTEWPQYQTSSSIGSDRPLQLIVNPGDFTVVEQDNARIRHSEFWNDVDRAIRLNK